MIRIKGITHQYGDYGTVLQDISFEVQYGEKVVLLGINGSGKSTLLKILNGLMFPDHGQYWYQNQTVTPKSFKNSAFKKRFRQEVVLLFQNPDVMLFNPTVYDEIAFGPRQLELDRIDERVYHWANQLGVAGYLDRVPFQLSGGEKQKVALASLLALEPRLLLLDEPTANMDPRSTGWLVEFLQDLNLTAIITTHNMSLATELGERTLVLSEHHQLLYDGEIHRLLADQEKLLQANLVHSHRHHHGAQVHRHFHVHDWD